MVQQAIPETGQWARVAKETGFKGIVFTTKHHDGFCNWPTATTRHGIAASPSKNGKGDLVKDLVDACRKEGINY